MLNRVQDKLLLRGNVSGMHFLAAGPQKSLLQWALADDYSAVLDMSCNNTSLLQALNWRYCVRSCGIAETTEKARLLRQDCPDAEIFAARTEDIPWKNETFDVAFLEVHQTENVLNAKTLAEANRVLKKGGQMLIALEGMPEWIQKTMSFLGLKDMDETLTRISLLNEMSQAGFRDITWRRTGATVGIAIGWK